MTTRRRDQAEWSFNDPTTIAQSHAHLVDYFLQ
jgi:hypothetical protein